MRRYAMRTRERGDRRTDRFAAVAVIVEAARRPPVADWTRCGAMVGSRLGGKLSGVCTLAASVPATSWALAAVLVLVEVRALDWELMDAELPDKMLSMESGLRTWIEAITR